jgi:hypothetical protein
MPADRQVDEEAAVRKPAAAAVDPRSLSLRGNRRLAPSSKALDRLDSANAQVVAQLNHFWYIEP